MHNILNLPEAIFTGNKMPPDPLIFHDYTAPAGVFSGKSVLNKNAVSLVISGEKTMHFAEKKVLIHADEFHLLSTGNCVVTMKLSEKNIFRSILVFFDDSVLTDFYLKYADIISGIKKKTGNISEPYLAFKKDAFILQYIDTLGVLLQETSTFSLEMRLLKFEELMLHLLEKYPDQLLSFPLFKNKNRTDVELQKAVEDNITSNISLEALAFLCNMSLSTFKRRFVKIYGTSPSKWILQKRIELACDLLQHQEEKPGAVFYKAGFESHSGFTQAFKKQVGITPSEFQTRRLNVLQQQLT